MLCDKCKKTYDDSFLFCPYCGKKKKSSVQNGLPVTRYQMIRAFSDEELVDFAQKIPKENAESIRAFLYETLPQRKVFVVGVKSHVMECHFGNRPSKYRSKYTYANSYERLQRLSEKPIESLCFFAYDASRIKIEVDTLYIEEQPLCAKKIPHIGKTVFFDEASIPYDIKEMQKKSDAILEWYETSAFDMMQRIEKCGGYFPKRMGMQKQSDKLLESYELVLGEKNGA